jgi:predicted secreted protein
MATGVAGGSGGAKLRRTAETGRALFGLRGGAVLLAVSYTILLREVLFGVRRQHEIGDIAASTDPGGPVGRRLVGKAIWTTLISVAGFAARVAVVDYAG